jgi:hypothetical protein
MNDIARLKRLAVFEVFLFVFILLVMLDENVYTATHRNIGTVSDESNDKMSKKKSKYFLPLNEWVGNDFIVLEMQNPKQFCKNFTDMSDILRNPTCEELVGKTFKITKIVPISADGSQSYVFLEDNQTKKMYRTTNTNGHTANVACLSDLSGALKKWRGKTIYSKSRSIKTYNEKDRVYGYTTVGITTPLKVIDAIWGFDDKKPIWLVVQTKDGRTGFFEISYSWTNSDITYPENRSPWQDDFTDDNIRTHYRWSDKVWNLINNQKIVIGMTKQQVLLSWGEPIDINEDVYENSTVEQWVYSDNLIYFKNGKVHAMQDL